MKIVDCCNILNKIKLNLSVNSIKYDNKITIKFGIFLSRYLLSNLIQNKIPVEIC